MKLNFFRRKKDLDELAEFESLLEITLIPVQPRTGFVSDLGAQLRLRGFDAVPQEPEEQIRKRMLVIGGIIGSALMILTSIRGLMALASVIRLLIQRYQDAAVTRRSATAA